MLNLKAREILVFEMLQEHIRFCEGTNRFRRVGVAILSLILVFSCVCNANFWRLFSIGGKILLSYSDLLWFSMYSIIPLNIFIEYLSNLHRNEHLMKLTTPIKVETEVLAYLKSVGSPPAYGHFIAFDTMHVFFISSYNPLAQFLVISPVFLELSFEFFTPRI